MNTSEIITISRWKNTYNTQKCGKAGNIKVSSKNGTKQDEQEQSNRPRVNNAINNFLHNQASDPNFAQSRIRQGIGQE